MSLDELPLSKQIALYNDSAVAVPHEILSTWVGDADRLERERDEALQQRIESDRVAQDARNDNVAINRELDRLHAPRLQPSGFGYSPLGRLRMLAHGECGRGLCAALENERDEWKKKAQEARDRAEMAERERDESNKRADECYRDRYDALSVHTREGLLASEWLLRTGKAERERDEALKHIAQLEDLYGSAALRLQELGEKEVSLTPLAALFADARAEVERLKAQRDALVVELPESYEYLDGWCQGDSCPGDEHEESFKNGEVHCPVCVLRRSWRKLLSEIEAPQ